MNASQLIDLSVVAVYIVAITVIGIWIGKKRAKTTEGYFLGDRQFNWVMIGFSLFATNVAMQFFVGGTGKAYKIGMAALTPELLGGLGLSISAIIFIPLYLRTSITTLPQFLEKRFNSWAKLFYGGVFVALAIITSPLSMYTASLAVLSLFNFEITPTNIYIVSAAVACTVGLYAVVGGLTAVVITDMIQVIIMLAGAALVLFIGVYSVGGIDELLSNARADQLELLRPHNDPEFPWSAMVTGQLLASCLWAFSNISMLQRVLGAKNLEHAQKGMLLGAGLKMLGLLFFIVPGLIASQLYPNIMPDTAYTTLVRELLPVGLSGLVLAGMIAAMMSSQDSGINAMASIVSLDIYPVIRKKASEREGVLAGKILAVSNIIWGVAAAPLFLTVEEGLFDLMLKFGGFLMMPNGLCYLLGRFWNRGNHQGCVTTLACGAAFGLYYNFTSTINGYEHFLPDFIANLHYYHLLPLFAIFLATIFVVVSLAFPPPAKEKTDFIRFNTPESLNKTPQPFYRRFGFWWALYLTVFVSLYVIF